ncbi:glycosyltransferase [Stutzerimonas nitrititolerans]|uniref:glycosyltransferase n=1 Tax=Stutzerimonas nitrititolerans TaxID=2482751 RepID=UPI003F7FE9DF
MSSVSSSGTALERLRVGLAKLRDLKAERRTGRAAAKYDVDVTVAVMSYNNGPYLAQTIESVLAQEGVSLELLVFDDRSSDDSVEILTRYVGDSRFSFQVNPANLGMAGNYNRCVQSGSGRYVVVLGSDDILYPGHLSSLVQAMDASPKAALGYTQCNWIDEHGNLIRYADHPGHRRQSYSGGRDEVIDLLTFDSYITPSASILRRSALLYVTLPEGGIHRHDMLAGDWELWIRLARTFPDFVFLRQPSVGYRVHSGQISNSFYGTERPLREHTEILEMNLEHPATRRRMIAKGEAIWSLYQNRVHAYPLETRASYQARIDAIHAALMSKGELTVMPTEFLFSIVMTTYNRPDLLRFALDSVNSQTLQDFEVILVNDHGEGVESLLVQYSYSISYLRQGRNRGPAAARNAAHRLARGRYVVYLDDDDIFLPDHLQTLADALQKHPGEVVYSDALFVAERIENDVRHSLKEERRYPHDNYSRERLSVDNYIPVNTFAWPRAVAAEVGEFDETLSGLEDWDFLLRLAARLPFHHVQRETVQVRMRVGDATPDRRSQQAFKDYPALYQELYSRHSDLGNPEVKRQRAAKLKQLGQKPNVNPGELVRTWLAARRPSPIQQSLIDQYLQSNQDGPRIGVLILDLQGDVDAITRTLGSLQEEQGYRNLQVRALTVGDFAGDSSLLLKIERDSYVDVLNQAAASMDSDWCVLVRAGERFTDSGLLIAALELVAAPSCRAIYADEIQLAANGEPQAVLRPDFNLDLLLSFPASMARHWLFRRDVFVDAGGFDAEYGQALELNLVLRLIEQGGLDGLGHVSEPLVIGAALQLEDSADERKAIEHHLSVRGYAGASVEAVQPGRYRLRYGHADQPGVSIVVPALAPLAKLQRCVESIFENASDVPFELLLLARDGQGDEVQIWLESLASMGEDTLRVLTDGAGGTLAFAQNKAAQSARGSHLLFLAADTVVLQADWLEVLLNYAQRPEVGAVGAKLLSPDGAIRHAGYVLGLNGPVSSPFSGESVESVGYMNRLEVDQNYSAVSSDCLMIPSSVFRELKGFDDGIEATNWADVDLCLKVKQKGLLTVWTPHVRIMKEAASVKLSTEEQDALYARWLPLLARDPSYNPNFSLAQPDGFKLVDTQISWRPLDIWRPLPVVLAHPADTMGCGHYRVMQPFNALREAGMVDGALSVGLMHVVDLERYNPDAVILQRQIGEERLETMRRIKAFSQAFKVYELDDYLPNLPMKNVHRQHMPKDIIRSLRRGLSYVDRFVVSTEVMAEAFAEFHPDIRVVRNRLDPRWWSGLPTSARRASSKPRVGWAGGASHTGDLEMITDVVKELADEVEWVFFGMCPEKLKPYIHEFHEGVAIERYAKKLASLNLDLALAPVEQNLFNECKSNLRLLEYGACGFPVICSDVRCYQGDGLPVTRVKNRFRDWVDAIRSHINDLDATARTGDDLRAAVLGGWMLESENLEAWRKAWLPS